MNDWMVLVVLIALIFTGVYLATALILASYRVTQLPTVAAQSSDVEMDRRVWRGLRFFKLKDGCLIYYAEEGQVRGISWDATGKACVPYPR